MKSGPGAVDQLSGLPHTEKCAALSVPSSRMAWPPKRILRASPVSAAGAGFMGAGSTGRSVPRGTPKGAAGNTRRYCPLKLPVALEAERTVFVYLDPGHQTTTALRS